MRITGQNYINFQKKLVAYCKVGQAPNSQKASIYKLEHPLDIGYYEKCARQDDNWTKSYYLEEIASYFELCGNSLSFYTMENEDGDTLCVSVMDEKTLNENRLDYLETAPKLSSYNSGGRKIKYIGETMLAFLVKLSKRDKLFFDIPDVAKRDKTKDFYFKLCGFHSNEMDGAYLNSYEFDAFVAQNEEHTNSQIEIL